MLITKFNKLIRNRILWIILASAFCIPMVLYFGPDYGNSSPAAARDDELRLADQPVPRDELVSARRGVMLSLNMATDASIPEEAEQEVRQMVQRRVVALRTAARLGFHATPGEINSVIRSSRPFCAEDGSFQPDRYHVTVLQLMDNRARPNEAKSAFESFIAQNIMLMKLQNLSGAMAWLPPEQVELGLADETDFRDVQYVDIPRSAFTADVAVAEADARSVYTGNTNRFALPEQVRVRYVEFAFTNFIDRVSITETNIAAYYEENVDERYTRLDTNNLSVVTPLSEVRGEIETLLRREALSEAADLAATRMAMRLVRGRAGPPLPFDEAAAREGVPVRTTEFFSAGEDVPGLGAGLDFNQAAFELQTGAVRNVSGVIAGEEARYVLAALERHPPRLPAFEEVADRAMQIARSNAQERAFSEHVGEVRRKLAEAMEGSTDFAAAAAAAGLAVQTTGTFAVFSGLPEGARHAEEIRHAVRTLPPRSFSEPVLTPDAGLLLYVASRTPAPPSVTARIRPRLLGRMQAERAGLTFRAWQESMLREARPEEPEAAQPESPEEADAGGNDAT